MNIPPTPVLHEAAAAPSQPVASDGPLSKNGSADNAAQTSFPAVLAQANQQGGSPKATAGGKDSSEKPVSLSVTQGETDSEGLGVVIPEVVQVVPSTLIKVPFVGSGVVPNSLEKGVVLSSAPKAPGENTTGNPSRTLLAPDGSVLVEDKPKSVGSPGGVSLPPATITVVPSANIPGNEKNLQLTPPSIQNEKNLQPVPPSIQKDQLVLSSSTREPLVSVPSGNRSAVPNVPLSFVNFPFPQGRPLVEHVQTSNLSPAISQNIQGSLPVVSGTPGVTVIDGTGTPTLSVVGEKGHAETGGSFLGSDQRSGQENGSAFVTKQQVSGEGLGGFSFTPEPGNDFRGSDTSSAGRTEMLSDRTRTMNMLSPQRMQMEVMLSDESKVQVEVSVKHQLVTAHLLTDQMMLRNLAIQQEPQLASQLSSVGLELKQFGAEVGEQGLFGQHLYDSSSQNSFGSRGHEASDSQEPEVLVGVGGEADGRLHYVV